MNTRYALECNLPTGFSEVRINDEPVARCGPANDYEMAVVNPQLIRGRNTLSIHVNTGEDMSLLTDEQFRELRISGHLRLARVTNTGALNPNSIIFQLLFDCEWKREGLGMSFEADFQLPSKFFSQHHFTSDAKSVSPLFETDRNSFLQFFDKVRNSVRERDLDSLMELTNARLVLESESFGVPASELKEESMEWWKAFVDADLLRVPQPLELVPCCYGRAVSLQLPNGSDKVLNCVPRGENFMMSNSMRLCIKSGKVIWFR